MPGSTAEKRRLVAQIAAQSRWAGEAPSNSRRDLAALQLEEHIRRLVDEAPPFTDAQRVRLTLLLNGGCLATSATAPAPAPVA